jgi:hypothetical protein
MDFDQFSSSRINDLSDILFCELAFFGRAPPQKLRVGLSATSPRKVPLRSTLLWAFRFTPSRGRGFMIGDFRFKIFKKRKT